MQWCVQLYHVTVGNRGIKTEAEAELRQVRALKKNVGQALFKRLRGGEVEGQDVDRLDRHLETMFMEKK